MTPKHTRIIFLLVIFFLIALAFTASANQAASFSTNGFEVGEQVELLRDEVLLFNQSPFRKGLKGERFQVAAHASARQRVFLLSKNEQGNLIALNVSELAVRRIAQNWIELNYKAFQALRVGKLEDAKKAMFYLGSVDPERAVCSEIFNHLEKLQKTKLQQKNLLKQVEQVNIDIERKLKNAVTAETPSALTKVGDTARAAKYRKEAAELAAGSKFAIEENIKSTARVLSALEEIAKKMELLKAYTEASSIQSFLESQSADYRKDSFHSIKWNQASLRAAADTARQHAITAQSALQERRLSDASDAVAEGLKAEPGSYALRKIGSEIQGKMTTVLQSYGKALELRENKQFEKAVLELQELESTCQDYPPSQKLLKELRSIISEKDALLAKAKVHEGLGEYEPALGIYETYSLTPDRQRVMALLATKREEEGNYIAAYDLFENLGRIEDMKRIQELRSAQEFDYAKARLSLAEGKFDEVLSIYRRFHDTPMVRDTLARQGAWLEGQARFDEAIVLYRDSGFLDELQRLKDFVNEREAFLRRGGEQEKAGNYDQAIDFFKKANASDALKRVASAAGKSYFERKDYASAVEYYEIAGLFEEAGRIRKEFNLDETIRRLSDQELFKRCAPACVTVSNGQVTGSGFFIKKGGYILTNNHCLNGAKNAKITTADGTVLDAKVVDSMKVPDLALLKANITENPVLRLGDSDSVSTGSPASTIGSPKGQPQSFTKGNISNVNRVYAKNICFQISVLINHGNSGGPLFDENGVVVGICTFGEGTAFVANGISIGSDIQGMNYAIKINEAKKAFGSTLAF